MPSLMSGLSDCQREDKRISGILKGLWDERDSPADLNNKNNSLLKALYRETSENSILSLLP